MRWPPGLSGPNIAKVTIMQDDPLTQALLIDDVRGILATSCDPLVCIVHALGSCYRFQIRLSLDNNALSGAVVCSVFAMLVFVYPGKSR